MDNETEGQVAKRGLMVAVEGPDGTGKTSLVREVAFQLRERGERVETISFPSDGPVGQFIRRVLNKEVLVAPESVLPLYIADGMDRQDTMRVWLEAGAVVLVDRMPAFATSWAYQLDNYSVEHIAQMANPARQLHPDLLFILDVPSEVAMERMKGRQADLFEDAMNNDASRYDELRLRFAAFRIMHGGYHVNAQKPLTMLAEDVIKAIDEHRESQTEV